MTTPDDRMSPGEAARSLGLNRGEIVRSIRLGSLNATRTADGRWQIAPDDLDAYARKRSEVPTTIYDIAPIAAATFASNTCTPVVHEERKP
jgi:excisionase family DNA binding protein